MKINKSFITLPSEEEKLALGIKPSTTCISAVIGAFDKAKKSTKWIIVFTVLAGIWLWKEMPLPF